ncbi:Flp family type IVb pilin [Pseudomonas lundensis]|uniref:Flp family type IVb pilin n=1 Tax=Pseudomonas lundensis TaxID=86185 RepID=UPI0014745E05|nr:Flp family type IVb pilin [Pseudomonas lundensis]MCT8953618.1 Flp family type IVb pilin [Pseudomonas lundensis]NNA15426.1 Flp family type IVb pilin [Pseudomonas lundensis]NNA34648.1 Flp family type IVb pilin [Pseudomonas lundensis]
MLLDTVLKVYVPTQAFCVYQAKQLIKRTEGASGIEYAIIAGMCAVVIAAFMTPIADVIQTTFTKINTGLGGKAPTP